MRTEKEFSGVRFITVLTPDTYTRKMIVVSTTWMNKKEGETAIAYAETLNSLSIDFVNLEYKICAKHEKASLGTVKDFHDELVSKLKFTDCPQTK